MTWNYRLVSIPDPRPELHPEPEPFIMLCECYYEKGNDVPYARTIHGATIAGETLEEVQSAYKMMAEAFTRPILDDAIFTRTKTNLQFEDCPQCSAKDAAICYDVERARWECSDCGHHYAKPVERV